MNILVNRINTMNNLIEDVLALGSLIGICGVIYFWGAVLQLAA